jgi:hypothetical protein
MMTGRWVHFDALMVSRPKTAVYLLFELAKMFAVAECLFSLSEDSPRKDLFLSDFDKLDSVKWMTIRLPISSIQHSNASLFAHFAFLM